MSIGLDFPLRSRQEDSWWAGIYARRRNESDHKEECNAISAVMIVGVASLLVGPASLSANSALSWSKNVALTSSSVITPNNASRTVACGFSRAKGSATIFEWGVPGCPTGGEKKVTLKVKDLKADGQYVGIRLHTRQFDGEWKTWKWHYNKSGKGATKTWHTSVWDSQGFNAVKVRVASFKGKKISQSCTKTFDPTG